MKKKSYVQNHCQYIQWIIPTLNAPCLPNSKNEKMLTSDFPSGSTISIFKVNLKGWKSKIPIPMHQKNKDNNISEKLKSNIQ